VLDRRGLDALSPAPAASAACTSETADPHIRTRLVARAYPWLTSGVSQPRSAGPSPTLTWPSSAQRAHPPWSIVACSRISDRASVVVAGPCPSSRAAASRRGDPGHRAPASSWHAPLSPSLSARVLSSRARVQGTPRRNLSQGSDLWLMHGSCRSRWMVQHHAPCSFRTSETSSRCPQSVVSITMMSDERHA
jgi:hypothetical protein